MFPRITKSRYLFFCKIEGLKENPSLISLDNLDNTELVNNEEIVEFEDYNADESKNFIYCPASLLLEDQIVSSLKLNKLNIYNLGDKKTRTILNGLFPIVFSSKAVAIKSEFIKYWKASFTTTSDTEGTGFRKTYKLSFITPANFNKNSVEGHLVANATNIKPTSTGPSYSYVTASLESVGGRKYKI